MYVSRCLRSYITAGSRICYTGHLKKIRLTLYLSGQILVKPLRKINLFAGVVFPEIW